MISIPKSFFVRPKKPTYCKTCRKGPMRRGTMIRVINGPLDHWFCDQECMQLWAQLRKTEPFSTIFKKSSNDRTNLDVGLLTSMKHASGPKTS